MPPPDQARRYIWIFLGCSVGTLLTIGIMNVLADPFRVFGVLRCAGWNDRVPDTSGFDRLAKPYEVLHVQPRTVLFGSSTAHSGFIDFAELEMSLPKPAYNHALLGADVYEIRLSLAHVLREAPVETVVMLADFFAFNVHRRTNERFVPERLGAASRQRWPGILGSDLAAFTLGRDAIRLSWQTFMASRGKGRDVEVPLLPDGYPWRVHFRNCEHSYLDKWLPPPARVYEFASARTGEDTLAAFDASLKLCAERGVRLIVLCPPIHARFHEALATAGVWPQYEQWKRELATRTRAHQAQPCGPGRVELWDFSLFNDYTGEPVPADGGGPMRYFTDSAHFTPEFGRLVLEEILKTRAPESSCIGVRLDRVDLESHLASVRAGLDAFRATHPNVVVDVRDALGRTSSSGFTSHP